MKKGAQRFLSVDPLAADFAAWSTYNYVLGNPINLVDPDGKKPEPPYQRLVFYGGGRKESHNQTFLHAARNVAKGYTDAKVSPQRFSSADEIVSKINAQANNSIQSVDIVSHGGTHAIYAGNSSYPRLLGNVSLYDSQWGQVSELAWNGGASIDEIDFKKFTKGAKIELHGCSTCSNAGGTGSADDNIAAALSSQLYGAGSTHGVVIGHETSANPLINGGKTSNSQQDYRHGSRVVYHNGEVLFKTNKKGRIKARQINKHLKKKLGDNY